MVESRKRRIAQRIVLASVAMAILIAAVPRRIRLLRLGTKPIGISVAFRFPGSADMFYDPYGKSLRLQVGAGKRHYDPSIELDVAVGGENHLLYGIEHPAASPDGD
jgi:hypothetical protein